jgi:5S rRNA maturation endonuclease (ribonuclease M5)
MQSIIPPIIYYPNFLFDFPTRIYLEKNDDETDEQETYRIAINDIIDSLGDGLNLNEHIVERMKSSMEDAQGALESTMDKMSSKITQVVFDAWKLLFNSEGKQIILKPGTEDDGKCYLEVKLKEGTSQFQISERSLGFKWFFTFLLFTEFRKNRSTENGEILFLLDEPASNLHSTAQKNLLLTFEKLVSNCKLIYTTHSHHLINPNWLSGAYIVRNKALDYEKEFAYDSEKTDVEVVLYKQFVVTHPQQKTYFQPILDALEYQPSLLEEVPNIILTEGKNDYYTLKYLNEKTFKNKYSELNFYPGNGADRNNQIIAIYLAWGRDFIILLDGDKAGEAAKKRYLTEFGKVLETKVITLKDIDPSFSFAMENLFNEDERLSITQYFDANAKVFEKSKFNTGLQTLYIEDEAFDFSTETLSKFEMIFKALQ